MTTQRHGLFDRPPAAPIGTATRRDGPQSSRDAEVRNARSVRVSGQRGRVMAVMRFWRLRGFKSLTAAELGRATSDGVEAYKVRRHLWHLEQRGLVEQRGQRICTVAGTYALTWRAVV